MMARSGVKEFEANVHGRHRLFPEHLLEPRNTAVLLDYSSSKRNQMSPGTGGG